MRIKVAESIQYFHRTLKNVLFFHFRLSLLSSRTFSTTILRRSMGSWSVVTLASRTSKSSFVQSYFIAFVSPPVPEKNICEHLFIKVKKRLSQSAKGWLFKCLGSAFFSIDSGKYLKSDVFRQLFCNILRIRGGFFFSEWRIARPLSFFSIDPPLSFFCHLLCKIEGGRGGDRSPRTSQSFARGIAMKVEGTPLVRRVEGQK